MPSIIGLSRDILWKRRTRTDDLNFICDVENVLTLVVLEARLENILVIPKIWSLFLT